MYTSFVHCILCHQGSLWKSQVLCYAKKLNFMAMLLISEYIKVVSTLILFYELLYHRASNL